MVNAASHRRARRKGTPRSGTSVAPDPCAIQPIMPRKRAAMARLVRPEKAEMHASTREPTKRSLKLLITT
jgi:hypothetical protein